MKHKYLILGIFPGIMGIFLFSNILYALTGSQIITNAQNYENFPWACNAQNARPANTGAWNYYDTTGGGGNGTNYLNDVWWSY